MPKAKKFIDKKKSVTFHLVHRSQRDPLIADENAPQRVLMPVGGTSITHNENNKVDYNPEVRREEQRKYGIFFDDDYNYLQHLKDTKEVTLLLAPKLTKRKAEPLDKKVSTSSGLKLPSSVFASEIEEDVGMLNKAAPQGLRLDLDPDVVAALDEDFNFEDPENELEDNFMELAMGEGDEYDEEYSEDGEDFQSENSNEAYASDQEWSDQDQAVSEDGDEDKPVRSREVRMPSWDQDETKSRFSQYSMSSSVMRRNDGLTMLDNRFEKMFAEYDDTEIGPLECEEIEGHLPDTDDMLLQAAEHFRQQQQIYQLDKAKEIARFSRLQQVEEESEDELVSMEVEDPKKHWDCESILSTYSNLYNHPKLIEEPKKPKKIKLHPKTGIPIDVLGTDGHQKLTMKSLAKFDAQNHNEEDSSDDETGTRAETILSTLSVLSIRPKDETIEEKKDRKKLLKEYRKERRVEKKANKDAFKEEKKRQEKIVLNNIKNVQGNRIF